MEEPMNYQCLRKQVWVNGPYSVTPLREEDIYRIREWRNEQMDVLRQNRLLTEADQVKYYQETVMASFEAEEPRIILFSFLLDGRCIGYGGLTNIDWVSGRAEISFLVDTARAGDAAGYREDFSAFLSLMKEVAFRDVHFNRLFTETFDIRPVHIEILEANGFRLEGKMREHVRIGDRVVDSFIHGYLKGYRDA
jgi:RimJ/RimL family protein N-acetyltransferase